MLKSKENKIVLLIIIIAACLMYVNFLSGYYSIDTDKIINLGYDRYAINYSFYDGRILIGVILIFANIIHINLKIFYIILLVISILVSSITVLKLYNIIKKYKDTNLKQKIILLILVFCYIFNFMTINNMEYVESIVIAFSAFLYILAAENIVIKKEPKKAFLYTFLAGICYQGTINMLFLTTVLFMLLEYKKEDKVFNKTTISCVVCSVGAIICNVILKMAMEMFIGNTIQPQRISLDILENVNDMFKNIVYLIVGSLSLFPKYLYLTFNILSLIIIYVYSVKNKKISIWYNAIFLFAISIISSLVLLIIFTGIQTLNGRVFGSIGASFSAIWLYVYVKTNIFGSKGPIKAISLLIVISFLLINCYSIFQATTMFKKANECDEKLAKEIVQKIKTYEEQTGQEVKYIEIKNDIIPRKNVDYKFLFKSMILTARFNEQIVKIYTDVDLERKYFEEEDIEKVKYDTIVCSGDTVYVLVK